MTTEVDVPWLDDVEMRAWMGYRRMKGQVDLALGRDLQVDSGLSDADYHVLSTLSETIGVDWRLRALAERLLWSPSRLGHHLSRMEQRGLVARERPEDARGAAISITAEGQRVIENAAPLHVRSVRRHFLDLLTRDELVGLAEISERVLAHLHGSPDSGE